ncbi:MAG: DUF4832 domain-containing protein [Chloroflexi bacterium]|nr:DUF4832 domain-containing protein [Chloroflexota bacterium]
MKHPRLIAVAAMLVSIVAGLWVATQADALFTGATSPDAGQDSPAITIQPARIDTYLTNPGIGWQHFEAVGEQLLPETVLYPDRNDIHWAGLNPAEDEYDWTALDAWFDRAAAEGKQLGFRVYTMRSGQDGHRLPEWVLEQGAAILENGEVDYSNCVYQAEWGRFVQVLRERYDGHPDVAFIDISGYGNYNEWSWRDIQTEWDDDPLSPTTLDGQARRRLADMFIGGEFEDHECTTVDGEIETVDYEYPGFEETQLVMPYAGIRQSNEYVYDRRRDVGIRFDCLGDPDITEGLLERIGDEIGSIWKTAPTIFEFCGTTTEDEYMQEAERLLHIAHGSLVHDNIIEIREPEPVEDLMTYVGYRYVLSEITYPGLVSPDDAATIEMAWQNVGYAPSYPRMGQVFELHIGLADESGAIVLDQVIETDISEWMPAEELPGEPPTNDVTAHLELPEDVSDGTYTLSVRIIDLRTDAPINLGFEGRLASGWYAIGPLEVMPGENED